MGGRPLGLGGNLVVLDLNQEASAPSSMANVQQESSAIQKTNIRLKTKTNNIKFKKITKYNKKKTTKEQSHKNSTTTKPTTTTTNTKST